MLAFLAGLDAGQIVTFSVAACVVMGIVCALSRGAWIATAGAVIVTGVVALAARRAGGAVVILAFVAATGIALAFWGETRGSVHRRFTELFDVAQSPWPHWEASSQAVPDFWRLGSGLGTYRHVYGLYEARPRDALFEHAENQYLETLVETGGPGLGLLLAMVGIVGWSGWYVLRNETDPAGIAFAIVAVFAVTAQVIHALFDFGLYIPANMLTFAVLCGAVAGRAAELSVRTRSSRWLALPRLSLLPLATAAALGAVGIWGFFELRGAAAVKEAVRLARVDPTTAQFRFDETTPGASAADLSDAIARLEAALGRREDDAEGQSQLGVLWTHLYHVQAFENLKQNAPQDSSEAVLWAQASLTTLHWLSCRFAEAGQPDALRALRSQPAVVEDLQPAMRRLLLARRDCPLLAEPHLGLGTLLPLEGDLVGDRVELERARRVQPTTPELLYQSGLLDFQAGRLDAAWSSWKTCLSLSDRFLYRVLWISRGYLADAAVVERLLPDEPGLLIRLTRNELTPPAYQGARAALTARALVLLDRGRAAGGRDLPSSRPGDGKPRGLCRGDHEFRSGRAATANVRGVESGVRQAARRSRDAPRRRRADYVRGPGAAAKSSYP